LLHYQGFWRNFEPIDGVVERITGNSPEILALGSISLGIELDSA
jgi:hypothetical protein